MARRSRESAALRQPAGLRRPVARQDRRGWPGRRVWLLRVGAAPALALVLGAVGALPSARAEGLQRLSLEGFHTEVVRLQGLVARCAAQEAACNSSEVGRDVEVAEEQRGGVAEGRLFEEHWDWLRSALNDAGKKLPGGAGLGVSSQEARTRLMQAALLRLQEMAEESGSGWEGAADAEQAARFAHQRAAADAVLAEPQFEAAEGFTWWDRAKEKMLEWLEMLFAGVEAVGMAAPWLGTLVEWVCFLGAAVGLMFFLWRNLSRARLRVVLPDEALKRSGAPEEVEDWARWAAQHAQAGQWRAAVHCMYWAAIVLLEGRRAWRHDPARTPREYLRLLKPGTAAEQGLRRLTVLLERVWYGLREARESEYAEARAVYEQLQAEAGEGKGAGAEIGFPGSKVAGGEA